MLWNAYNKDYRCSKYVPGHKNIIKYKWNIVNVYNIIIANMENYQSRDNINTASRTVR